MGGLHGLHGADYITFLLKNQLKGLPDSKKYLVRYRNSLRKWSGDAFVPTGKDGLHQLGCVNARPTQVNIDGLPSTSLIRDCDLEKNRVGPIPTGK